MAGRRKCGRNEERNVPLKVGPESADGRAGHYIGLDISFNMVFLFDIGREL